MSDPGHFERSREEQERRLVNAADKALRERRALRRTEVAARAAQGAAAARALGPLADDRTRVLVSGLVHDHARMERFIIVRGADGAVAAVEATRENLDRAEAAKAAGIVASYCTAAAWFGALP